MSSLSADAIASTSKRLQAGLQSVAAALAQTPLDDLAKAIGKEDTQVSRIRSNQLGATVTDVIRMLHVAGLKVVSAQKVCVERSKYEAMVTIASAAMSCPETVRKLTWDEE